jgi:hypothetical protein
MMKQHTSTFQNVLHKLESWQNPNIESCERRSKRYSVRCQARLICEAADTVGESPDQIVQIRDVSRTGAGLLCCLPVETGTRWRLQPITEDMVLTAMPVFCRFCRRVEDGAYLVGVEFGIEAATMIALGVSPSDLQRDETAGGNELLSEGQFVDPSELFEEDAA